MGSYVEAKNIEIDNPYSILHISQKASIQECRSAFMRYATNPNRLIRTKACLAYDLLCNKEKNIKEGNKYKSKEKDCFYCTVVGVLNALKYKI